MIKIVSFFFVTHAYQILLFYGVRQEKVLARIKNYRTLKKENSKYRYKVRKDPVINLGRWNVEFYSAYF